MWGPGGPSCAVRWLCHLPTGAAGVLSLIDYYMLADVPTDLLDVLENGHAFAIGIGLNALFVSRHPFEVGSFQRFKYGCSPVACIGGDCLRLELLPVCHVTED